MPRLTKLQKKEVEKLTNDAMDTLLRFQVSFGAMHYVHEDAVTNWRQLEDRLHINYPVRGTGIRATKSNLRKIDSEDGGFLHRNERLYPGEVPEQLQAFPYAAASAAYAFTLLEGYGDKLCDLVNPGYLKARQAWHHGVYGDADLTNKAQLAKAKENFAKPFNLKASRVDTFMVQRLVSLKYTRNKFMHEGSSEVDFEEFSAYVLGTVASLFLIILPSNKEIVMYPYYDYDDKWK